MERERKKAQEHFDSEKKKLDKARELDVISEEEYDEKLAKAMKKLENFDILKKSRCSMKWRSSLEKNMKKKSKIYCNKKVM